MADLFGLIPSDKKGEEVMAPRFLTILTGHNLPKILQPREPESSTINGKTIADFARVVEQTGILERGPSATDEVHGPEED
jgi:hypothetical protein